MRLKTKRKSNNFSDLIVIICHFESFLTTFWPIFTINLPVNGWKFGNLSVNIQYMIVHDWKTIYIRIFGFIDLVTVNSAIFTPFSQVGVKKGPKNGGWAHFFDYCFSDPSFGTFGLHTFFIRILFIRIIEARFPKF